VCAEASWIGGIDDLVFAFEGDDSMVEELGGRRACSGLRLWSDIALVTMAQESAACVDLLSHVVVYGGVWCCGRLFCCGVRCVVVLPRPVMYHCSSSYKI
jgi:hypothetical protein